MWNVLVCKSQWKTRQNPELTLWVLTGSGCWTLYGSCCKFPSSTSHRPFFCHIGTPHYALSLTLFVDHFRATWDKISAFESASDSSLERGMRLLLLPLQDRHSIMQMLFGRLKCWSFLKTKKLQFVKILGDILKRSLWFYSHMTFPRCLTSSRQLH